MKKAIINVHGNPTLSRIVQELAFKAGYRWLVSGNQVNHTEKGALHFSEGGDITHSGKTRVKTAINASREFDKVIAFFEQPHRPVIKVGSHTVEWSDDNKTIKVGCTVVPAETVKAIHDELFKK